MFTVHHINFGTFREFKTFDEAKAWAVKACFEAVVTLGTAGTVVGTFSPISGFRKNPAYY
jgi:hypothetical protein